MKKQLTLNLYQGTHGGRRPNSGRRAENSKGVRHRVREKISDKDLLHINFKYKIFIKSPQTVGAFKKAIHNSERFGLSIIHFSILSNHIHLIAEARSNKELTSGMRSVTVTLSRQIGKGKIQFERYHLHVLKSPREARNAIQYVLTNERHHSGKCQVDEFSSLYSLELKELKTLFFKEAFSIKKCSKLPLSPAKSWVYKAAYKIIFS